jgi:hypothetical protein
MEDGDSSGTTRAVRPSGESPCQVVQFHVIRGPDEMVGSSNQGGASLFLFALDSTGQLWRAVVAAKDSQPSWSRMVGPLDPRPTAGH